MGKNNSFSYFNMLNICMWPKVINKVKVTHQGEGHSKVKVKYLHPFKLHPEGTSIGSDNCNFLKVSDLNGSL